MKRREVEFTVPTADRIDAALSWASQMIERGLPAGPVAVRLGRPRRSLDQNAHIHPLVRAIKQHMESHGAAKRSEDWWRYYLLGKYSGQDITPDPDGSGAYVVINRTVGTSDLRKDEAADLIEFLYAFGVDVGVDWSERHRAIVDEHGRKAA